MSYVCYKYNVGAQFLEDCKVYKDPVSQKPPRPGQLEVTEPTVHTRSAKTYQSVSLALVKPNVNENVLICYLVATRKLCRADTWSWFQVSFSYHDKVVLFVFFNQIVVFRKEIGDVEVKGQGHRT